MNIFSPILWQIAFRSLMQHTRRTFLLGGVIALVATVLVFLTGMYTGIRTNLIVSATTLMSGHVNVGGFYKATASQSAPVVTQYKKITELVKREFPEVDYTVQRGRGWAKMISDSASMQVGLGGIDISNESGFKKVVEITSGNLDDLKKPNSVMIFGEQAKKLEVKVGDTVTVSAPTSRGTNNTIDLTVVAIAQDIGMLSSWNTFMNEHSLRQLYQLNEDTTGAIQIYLKDIKQVKAVQERMRKVLGQNGFELLDNDPRPFWMKFDAVNRDSWTGQKLDVTNWEDETAFVQWMVTLLTLLGSTVILILVVIIGVGIMNVMWISIRERTREIGTLRAVGMQRTSVLQMFLTEGFLLGLMGTSLGTVIGLVLSAIVNNANVALPQKGAQMVFMTNHLIVTPTFGWVMFGILFITGSITAVSVIPSFLAARMKPITAMSQVG